MKVTMKDIAREAEVSSATVSHVINGTKKISEPTQQKILELIQKYNYVPNSTAKNLRVQSTKTAALVVSSLPDTFISELVYGVEERAREAGYNLLLVNTNEDEDYEQKTINLLHSKMVDGIVLSPAAKNLDYLNEFDNSTFPIVLVNRYAKTVDHLPRVTGNNVQTGYEATSHLLDHGHRSIGVIYGVADVSSTNDRLDGYRQALKERNIPFEADFLELGHATVAGGAGAVENLLRRNPEITALFIQNDLMTIGVISRLKEMSLAIPGDVALIGFGDFASAPIIDPPITTIVQPPKEIGSISFDALLQKIENPAFDEHQSLPAEIICRHSCGC